MIEKKKVSHLASFRSAFKKSLNRGVKLESTTTAKTEQAKAKKRNKEDMR